MRLKVLIGNDAFWAPLRIWSYAAENQPDGDFSDYQPEELGMLLGYASNASSIIQAMQKVGFMDGMKIHDWLEHNEFHHTFSERAKNAAKARWSKEESTKEEEMKGNDMRRDEMSKQCLSNASSNASSIKKKKVINDEEFMTTLKANPAYHGINLDDQLSKMDAWLLAHPGRKKTRKFIVGWLNRCDKPLASQVNGHDQKPSYSFDFLNKNKNETKNPN